MLELKAHDWFTITGCGKVASVYIPEECEVRIRDKVRIDGKVYEVCGIESTRTLTYPPKLSRNFGLQVKEVTDG